MKLNYGRTILIGFAFMSICAFWQLYDSAIPLMLDKTFGLGETIVGVIMALDNIFALFMLPLFGALSDKTNTRFGRRTPYIVFGTVAAVVIMVLIPYADEIANLPFFIIALLGVLISMAVYRAPAVAMMPDLTPKPLRSKANAVINLMGAVGGVFTLALIAFTKPSVSGSYQLVFVIVAAVMALSVAVLVLTIRERKIATEVAVYNPEETKEEIKAEKKAIPREVKRSLIFLLISVFLWFFAYNAISSTFSRYTAAVWNDTTDSYSMYLMAGTVIATLSYFPVGIISSRIGRKKVIITGLLMIIAALIFGTFITKVSFLAYIVFGLVGIGWASVNVNSYPMVVEMSTGSDVGKYTGYYYTFSMAAQILTPVFSGFLIENLDIGYSLLFPYAIIFMALAVVTMLFVKHGDVIIKKGKVVEK